MRETRKTGDEEPWLGLTDYASKYRISVSTLRRRIRQGLIAHRLEDGKYYICDEALSELPVELPAEPSLASTIASSLASAPDEPIFSSASRLVGELKRAYMNVLQEKEEQMIQLKREVIDLKTLVRVLEDDNARLRRNSGERELR